MNATRIVRTTIHGSLLILLYSAHVCKIYFVLRVQEKKVDKWHTDWSLHPQYSDITSKFSKYE